MKINTKKHGEIEFLIGADPEMFIRNPGKRFYCNAHDKIPGTKADPHPVKDGAVQVDGMAVEFNINPAATEDEFVNNCNSVMSQLEAMVAPYELVATPLARFTKKAFQVAEAKYPESLELGCDPDFDAYTGKANPRPDASDINYRTGAGHIHIGWGEDIPLDHPTHQEACRAIAQQLDYFLGLPSLGWDDCHDRRTLYGKAGAYRPKSYGMEYRTLSNAWLLSEERMRFVYTSAIAAIKTLSSGENAWNLKRHYNEYAREVINTIKKDNEKSGKEFASRFIPEANRVAEEQGLGFKLVQPK